MSVRAMPHHGGSHAKREFKQSREGIAIKQRERRELILLLRSRRRRQRSHVTDQRKREHQQATAGELPLPCRGPSENKRRIDRIEEAFDGDSPRRGIESEYEPFDRNPCIHQQDWQRQYRPRCSVGGCPKRRGHRSDTEHQAEKVHGPNASKSCPVEPSDSTALRQSRVPVTKDKTGKDKKIRYRLCEVEPRWQRISKRRSVENEYGKGGNEAGPGQRVELRNGDHGAGTDCAHFAWAVMCVASHARIEGACCRTQSESASAAAV